MSTTNSEVTYTNQALDLLSSFLGGFDDVVLEVAERIARAEAKDPKGSVCVDAKHVTRAGEKIIKILREQLENGEIDTAMAEFIVDAKGWTGSNTHGDDE